MYLWVLSSPLLCPHTASQFTFAFPFPPLLPPPLPFAFSIGSVSPPMLGRGPGSVSSPVQQQPMQQQHIFLHGLNSGWRMDEERRKERKEGRGGNERGGGGGG